MPIKDANRTMLAFLLLVMRERFVSPEQVQQELGISRTATYNLLRQFCHNKVQGQWSFNAEATAWFVEMWRIHEIAMQQIEDYEDAI